VSGRVVAFDVPSPLGTLRCAATSRGLALVTLPGSDHDASLARLAPHGAVRRARHPAAAQLRAWFDGRRRDFDVPLDLALVSGFTRDVLVALARVPFGELVTYGELARRAGSPEAARAVGRAVGANPLPIVVPCHRVVAAGRRLGGFGGGLPAKRALLEHEGHEVRGAAEGRWSVARVTARGLPTSA